MQGKPFNIHHLFDFSRSDIQGISELAELALDLRWSWNHSSDQLWRELDQDLWQQTHNPWIILKTVSKDKLIEKLGDPAFQTKLTELIRLKGDLSSAPAWFQATHSQSTLNAVAYFSMEFMLSEALPIYVGGLGNVAGDQLKSASDLGVPVIGVGLLYQQGYFRQVIDTYGRQQALYSYNDPGQLPIVPLRLENGEWLRLKISLCGSEVWLRTWEVRVGRTRLYLLDSNDPANAPVHRAITNELYGGGPDIRIQQELVLGIGGWKLLAALDINPEVCHMNEGHAAFVVLARAGDFMRRNNCSFEDAMAVTRAGNIFTTHTAVAAGFDQFSAPLMEQYLAVYAQKELDIEFDHLMSLGRHDPANESEEFKMAYLAIRGSMTINGVSELHGSVSRQLFSSLFPRWPISEIPVGHVTNGVHMPTWDSEMADAIWTNACGKNRWRGELSTMSQSIADLPDETLWEFRQKSRGQLVDYTRNRLFRQLTWAGYPCSLIEYANHIFNPEVLTLAFARRFVPYKRTNLLLNDPPRLVKILRNPDFPIQLIIAGKAPPHDEPGKQLIQQWVNFIQDYQLQDHVVFLSDYDMLVTEMLVQGADVWLNTPKRPWEACGTSGMKVLVNGGLNLSELDGWWAEAYSPSVGWALGDGREHQDFGWDATEANELYELLENKVIPEFYTRNSNGIPVRWVERVRQSMAKLTPVFSANRTVRQYTEQYYIPAASRFNERIKGWSIRDIQRDLKNRWADVAFRILQIDNANDAYKFHISVWINGINPEYVKVELFADDLNGGAPMITPMFLQVERAADGAHIYLASINTKRPVGDFTPRVVPAYKGISVPLEDNHILWYR
jgi:starch phosphorylase